MKMLNAQYIRIETKAGGITCTDRQFIRQARKRLSTDGKSFNMREWRKEWLLSGLELKQHWSKCYVER